MSFLARFNRVLGGLSAALLAFEASAQVSGFEGLYKDRAGRMEVTLGVNNTSSWSREHDDGSSLDVDSDTGWSFGLAYNFDSHWNFGFNMDFNSQDYTAVLANDNGSTTSISHDMSVYHAQFNGTYHLMTGAFTPYVQAGAGWSTFDSNITRPGSEVCWWDPWWWTTYCTWDTYGDTEFSYNLGVGLRYEFNRNLFVRAGYTSQWAEAGGQEERLDLGRIEIGFVL